MFRVRRQDCCVESSYCRPGGRGAVLIQQRFRCALCRVRLSRRYCEIRKTFADLILPKHSEKLLEQLGIPAVCFPDGEEYVTRERHESHTCRDGVVEEHLPV